MQFRGRISFPAAFAFAWAVSCVAFACSAPPVAAACTTASASEFRVGRSTEVDVRRMWRSDCCAMVAVHYDPTKLGGQEKNLKLTRWTSDGWLDITASADYANDMLTGRTTPFSATAQLSRATAVAENDDPLISYLGPWTTVASPDFSGGSVTYGATGCEVAIAFEGTGIDLIALTGPNYGVARATIDNAETTMIDLYSPTFAYKQLVFSRRGLPAGPHVLRLEHAAEKNAASSNTRINLDAVGIVGTLVQAPRYPVRFDESDARIAFTTGWTSVAAPDFSGGGLAYGSTACAARVAFTGTSVAVVALKGPSYGIARVTLDGQPTLVDLYAPDYLFKQVVFSREALANTDHVLTIEYTAEKNAASGSARVNLDALDVGGTLVQATPYPTRFESSDERIAYAGPWSTFATSDFSGGSVSCGAEGCSARICFTGTSVDLVALAGPTYGIARVTLDGEPTLVDLYSPDYLLQQVVFSRSGLADAPHVLLLEHIGEKDPASESTRISLDAFDIVGTLTAP